MLSPVFWLSLISVFLVTKWVADGLRSLAQVELRRKQVPRTYADAARVVSTRELDTALDKAA